MTETNKKKLRILVVEDDKTMRMVLCHLLRQLGGVELVEVGDGLEAWKQLEQGLAPDLCVVDILMPGIDGLDLVRRIRAHGGTRHLPVIICSSAKERNRIAEAVSLKVTGYILKPFQAKFLQAEVRRVLGLAAASTPIVPAAPAPAGEVAAAG